MTSLGDPSLLERIADRYDLHSETVCTTGRHLRHSADTTTWSCDAADRFRVDVLTTQLIADRLADDLRVAAQRLRAHAASVRAEIAALAAIEARVRSALATADPYQVRWVAGDLPPSGDTRWRAVAHSMGL